MLDWLKENEWLWWYLGTFSVISVVVAIFATPWMVARIRHDYFMPDRDESRAFASLHPVLRWTGLVLKNLLGVVLVCFGIILLAMPGQGILTVLAGLVLMNFPGKRALELWIIRLPMVLKAANWLRAKAGRGPLEVPEREKKG